MKYIDEIKQHPTVLRKMIDYYFSDESRAEVEELKKIINGRKFTKYVFTGMGSSLFAGYSPCIFLKNKGINAIAIEANELLRYYGQEFFNEETLIIAISQSGDSGEVVELCPQIRKENLVIVTNNADRSLYKFGDIKFLIQAGPETKSASKTYTNTLAVLMLLAHIISDPKASSYCQVKDSLLKCEENMQKILNEWEQNAEKVMRFIDNTNHLCVVGSGPSYETASQSEILLMEAAAIYSSRYTTGQFLHGTVEIVSEEFRAIVLDFQEESRSDVDKVLKSIQRFSGKAWILSNREEKILENGHFIVTNVKTDKDQLSRLLTPLLEIIPIELLIHDIAVKKNFIPGQLRSVQK